MWYMGLGGSAVLPSRDRTASVLCSWSARAVPMYRGSLVMRCCLSFAPCQMYSLLVLCHVMSVSLVSP